MEAAVGRRGGLADLSEDLLPGIFCWLPAVSLARMRSVCKTWNRIITSQAAAKSQDAQPWLFVHRAWSLGGDVPNKNVLRAFDPVSCRWFGFRLPEGESSWPRVQRLELCGGPGGDSGLLLLREYVFHPSNHLMVPHDWHYWVGNPVLQRWQHVACDLEYTPGAHYVHQLVVDEKTKDFKILCFQFNSSPGVLCRVHIYDSCEPRWRREATVWMAPVGYHLILSAGVGVSRDAVYFLFSSIPSDILYGDIQVVGYLVEQRRFEVAFPGIRFPARRPDRRWKVMWLKVDDRGQRPAPALLAFEGHKGWSFDRIDITTFAQDQYLDWSTVVQQIRSEPRFFRRHVALSLQSAGNLKGLYVGRVSGDPNSPDEFMIYASSEWTRLPQDHDRHNFLCTSFSIGTFLPRFDIALETPDMNPFGSRDSPSCLACSLN